MLFCDENIVIQPQPNNENIEDLAKQDGPLSGNMVACATSSKRKIEQHDEKLCAGVASAPKKYNYVKRGQLRKLR